MDPLHHHPGSILGTVTPTRIVLALVACCIFGPIIYNVYLHPLRRFPGPLIHRATSLGMVYKLIRGTLPVDVKRLHDKYGPVVRVSVNELSFVNPQAWKDIYAHGLGERSSSSTSRSSDLPKYPLFYRNAGDTPNIFAETPENHDILRRRMAQGFSNRAMQHHEPIITGYVDQLIDRLRMHCSTQSSKSDGKHIVNMKDWYDWTSFDIIGDLVFGEPLGCLEVADYHPWVRLIFSYLKARAYLQVIKYAGVQWIARPLLKHKLRARKEHGALIMEKLHRRIELGAPREDLIEGLLEKDDWHLDFGRIHANARVLVVAGSETTATALSGVTYLLLKNPSTWNKLAAEVRSAFTCDRDITFKSVQKLPFLQACIDEGLRRYPPVPIGFPRVVPEGGAVIAGEHVPAGTVVACWHYAMYHVESTWSDPYSYKPERFLSSDGLALQNHDALQPFQLGPTGCLGKSMAYSELRLILARVIFNFDLALPDDPEDDRGDWLDQKVFTVWEKGPLKVSVTPVQYGKAAGSGKTQ